VTRCTGVGEHLRKSCRCHLEFVFVGGRGGVQGLGGRLMLAPISVHWGSSGVRGDAPRTRQSPPRPRILLFLVAHRCSRKIVHVPEIAGGAGIQAREQDNCTKTAKTQPWQGTRKCNRRAKMQVNGSRCLSCIVCLCLSSGPAMCCKVVAMQIVTARQKTWPLQGLHTRPAGVSFWLRHLQHNRRREVVQCMQSFAGGLTSRRHALQDLRNSEPAISGMHAIPCAASKSARSIKQNGPGRRWRIRGTSPRAPPEPAGTKIGANICIFPLFLAKSSQ
jgi:hypothetical protein